jgi:hypothetical protein
MFQARRVSPCMIYCCGKEQIVGVLWRRLQSGPIGIHDAEAPPREAHALVEGRHPARNRARDRSAEPDGPSRRRVVGERVETLRNPLRGRQTAYEIIRLMRVLARQGVLVSQSVTPASTMLRTGERKTIIRYREPAEMP